MNSKEALAGLNNLSPFEQFHALSPEQFQLIPKSKHDRLPSLILKIYEHRVEENESNHRWTPEEVRKVQPDQLKITQEQIATEQDAPNKERQKTGKPALKEFEVRELFLSAQWFTHEQIAAIDPAYIRFFWSLPVLSKKQIQAFQENQIPAFSADQLNLLSFEQIQALTDVQKEAINSNIDQVRSLTENFLRAVLPGVTELQVQCLSTDDIAELQNRKDYLTLKFIILQCQFLSRDQFQALSPLSMHLFSESNLQSLEVNQLEHILPEQLEETDASAFSGFSADHVAHFTEAQLQVLTVNHLKKIASDIHKSNGFTPRQIPYIKPELVATLKPNHFINLFTAKNIPHLTPIQILALTVKQVVEISVRPNRIKAVTCQQIPHFKPDLMRDLRPHRLFELLTVERIPHLNQEQIQILTQAHLEKLAFYDHTKIDAFTPQQIEYFTAELVRVLNRLKAKAATQEYFHEDGDY